MSREVLHQRTQASRVRSSNARDCIPNHATGKRNGRLPLSVRACDNLPGGSARRPCYPDLLFVQSEWTRVAPRPRSKTVAASGIPLIGPLRVPWALPQVPRTRLRRFTLSVASPERSCRPDYWEGESLHPCLLYLHVPVHPVHESVAGTSYSVTQPLPTSSCHPFLLPRQRAGGE